MNKKKIAPKKTSTKKTVSKKTKSIKKTVKKTSVKKPIFKKVKAVKKVVKKTSVKKPVSKKVKIVKKVVKKIIAKKIVEKKKLIKSPFKKKDLVRIREKLIEQKQRIIEDVIALKGGSEKKSFKDMSGDLSGYSFHMADMATDLYDREFSLSLAEGERERLFELDEAIKKIDSGSYGICETCGEKIPNERLKVMPHAKYCIKHQEELERSSRR